MSSTEQQPLDDPKPDLRPVPGRAASGAAGAGPTHRPAEPAEPETEPMPPARRAGPGRVIVPVVLGLLVATGAAYGVRTMSFFDHHASTDDAQIDGHVDPVIPQVGGYVTRVLVKDNEPVRAGQVLVKIEPGDYQARMEMANASLASAVASLAAARADEEVSRTADRKAATDLARYRPLRAEGGISQQQFDDAQAAAEEAHARLDAAAKQVAAAAAQVAQKRADLDLARLQLSYTTVTAPVAGTVSKKSVEPGQMVQAGQALLSIVQDRDVWVVANYKETQLTHMRPGQPVEVEVDAYPGVRFQGRVESIASATGARFALLPPDNATGNFTKVVQRVPVKIVLTGPPDPAHPLRVGMSVKAVVATG